MHGRARASPEVVMVSFIIVLACVFGGMALHLYQMLSLLVWIGQRAQCGDRCEAVVSPAAPAFAVVSSSAEPPDWVRCTDPAVALEIHPAWERPVSGPDADRALQAEPGSPYPAAAP